MPSEERTSHLQSRLLPAVQKVLCETEYAALHHAMGNPDVTRLRAKTIRSVPSFKAVLVIREEKKEKKKHTEEIKHVQIALLSPLLIITFPAIFANGNNNNHCSRITLWLPSQILLLFTRQ